MVNIFQSVGIIINAFTFKEQYKSMVKSMGLYHLIYYMFILWSNEFNIRITCQSLIEKTNSTFSFLISQLIKFIIFNLLISI